MTMFLRVATVFAFSFLVLGKSVNIPIEKAIGSLVIAKIKIAEKEFKFLIDSGSNANFIDPSALNELKEKLPKLERDKSKDTFVNTFGGKQKSEAYKMDLKIGEFQFKDMPAFVMNTTKFSEKADGIKCCDGILGIDFIKNFPFEVNIKKKVITIHEKPKVKKGWKKLPINMEGKNVITFTCRIDGSEKLKVRLDSGSEAPLIFHQSAVDKFLLREMIFNQGFEGKGLPFVNIKSLKCGEIDTKNLVSTYFYGSSGALTHKEVDGNLGSHLLGSHYLFDLKNKTIYSKGDTIPFEIPKKKYNFVSGFKFDQGHHSLLNQAQALIVNSCKEAYNFQECMKKLCHLEGKKVCVFKESGQTFRDFVDYVYPLKTNDCSWQRLVHELRFKPVRYNFCWYKLAETNPQQYDRPYKKIGLPKTFKPYNEKVQSLEVASPYTVTKDFYCYSIYQGIVTQGDLPASLFGLSVKGISLSRNKLDEYKGWLNSYEGQSCQQHLKDTIGVKATSDLSSYFKKQYLVLVNPFTLLGDGLRDYKYNYERALNHELLHTLYALKPAYKKWAIDNWNELDDMQQKSFKDAHPSYNFENKNILYREYFSYQFEDDPELLESLK